MREKLLALFLVVSSSALFNCKAQFTVLHYFQDTGKAGNADGRGPLGINLIISGNVMYGMTSAGGSNNWGNIFSIDTNGSGYKDLWDFDDTNGINGETPESSLTLSGSVLYGNTGGGGRNGVGMIFSINTNGTGYKDLYDFSSSGNNPDKPVSALVLLSGKLFGMTNSGGVNANGVIFSINTNGSSFQDIFDLVNGLPGVNGLTPSVSGNQLFGLIDDGGPNYSAGSIFSISVSGSRYNEFFDFNGNSNGALPEATPLLLGGKIYGMTNGAGANNEGCIFSIDTNGANFRDLFDFTATSGNYPESGLISSGRFLYGMTSEGGTGSSGTIFSIDTNGSQFRIMYNFNGTQGANPWGELTLSGKFLYGMTQNGGVGNNGVIFRIDTGAIASFINLTRTNRAINVYPNPGEGLFNLQLNNLPINPYGETVEVFNISGVKIYSKQFFTTGEQFQINLSGQPNGVYLYSVQNVNGGLIGEGKLIILK